MSRTALNVSRKVATGIAMCMLGTAAGILPTASPVAAEPQIVRGIPDRPVSAELSLAYLATLPWIGPVTKHSLAHNLGLAPAHEHRAVA